MSVFTHLHVHTQYSLLDGAAAIGEMMEKAVQDNMKAVALTDHGNMFGAFKFVSEARKRNLKPIVGCEFYMVEDRHQKTFTKENKDNRYHQLLLAKNQAGYQNLAKLCSLGYIEGMYSKWPRIDKELLLQYHEGLIATSCCIGAEIPQTILFKGEAEAEEKFKWWHDLFGEDFYVELQRHHLKDLDGTGISQEDINQVLIRFARKYNCKIIATNDSHYVDKEDFNAHDILLCVNTGELKSTPIGQGYGKRFGFPNSEFYFKTQAEMTALFSDIPEALDNTNDVIDKITPPELKRDILLPNFALPSNFTSQDDYLKHLCFEGAQRRYPELGTDVRNRLDMELEVIKKMGFSGYFLIVQDFIAAAKKIGVAVGPGRGSAAGSAVAFCTGITNIDPIQYNLLFERFLNPERISMPDIDIDFDDEGRQRVIDYVVDKYGQNQVAQIITYGTMASKMAIRDVARVLDLPLQEADKLSKMVPDMAGSLHDMLHGDLKELSQQVSADAMQAIKELRKVAEGKTLQSETLKEATILEGSVRNTGIHAAGVIIAPADITNYIPVCTSKDADLWVTQFDGKVIEDAGMLKMDFLGLKTLTIIKDAIENIQISGGAEIDPDKIPLDDLKTFELYQRGDTIGTFQFESQGMQKHLKDLKPTDIEDLIAMNALYRPGPMQFIENFIKRKHGLEKVEFAHELLEPILKNTHGIMVYQEQIMQTAQILGGYSLGGADLLRRAMGKKDMKVMEQQRAIFIAGAKEKHQIEEWQSSQIFDIMMKFAAYGFNRSHSAAYSVVAFQTAYLKANHTAEYMAAVLTNNMNDIKKITFFMEECKRMGLRVLGPDVNESMYKFTVNKKGQIRFGLGAVKGVGAGAVETIIEERKKDAEYSSIFDLVRRIDLRAANKKSLENLALAGAFDSLGEVHRAQFFQENGRDGSSFLASAIKYGAAYTEQQNATQQSLFDEGTEGASMPEPLVPEAEPWSVLETLSRERDVVGIYISGHPMDTYQVEVKHFCNTTMAELGELSALSGKEVTLAGIVTSVNHRTSKKGKQFATFDVEDYAGTFQFVLFSEDYLKMRHFLVDGNFLYIRGKVQPRKYRENELELKIISMELLAEVRDKLAKTLNVSIPNGDISEELVEQLYQLVGEKEGKCKLKFTVVDRIEKLKVVLPATTGGIDVTDSLLAELDSIPALSYVIE